MPHTVAATAHERLRLAAADVMRAYFQLEQVISAWPGRGSGGVFTPPGPRPPWASAAANLIFELRSEARYEEQALRRRQDLPERERGGSDKNTLLALQSIQRLAEGCDESRAGEIARWLERWASAAARVLGNASAIIRLPRQPGERERPCPFCAYFTLRYWPLHGLVRCINVTCRDDDGRRPSARIEYSSFTAQLELVWQDGVSGLPPLPEEAAP